MKIYLKLVLVNLTAILSGLFRFGKGKNSKQKVNKSGLGFGGFLLLVALGATLYVGFYSNLAAQTLTKYGLMWLLLGLVFLVCSFFTLMTSVYAISEILFSGKDLDLLMSFPIKKWQILASKFSALILENYLMYFILLTPVFGVYYYYERPSLMLILYYICAVIFLPLIPIILAAILSFIINIISAGKRFTMIIRVLLSLILILGVSLLPSFMIANFEKIIANSGSIFNAMKRYYPPVGYLTEAITQNKPLSLLIFVAMSFLVFALFILLASNQTAVLWSKSKNVKSAKSSKYKVLVSGQFSALLKKEADRFFNSYIYLLNASFGIIMLTVAAVASIFMQSKISPLLDMLGEYKTMLPVMLLGCYCFTVGLNCTTAPSISLEGNGLWILKSCPVDVKKILYAKLLLNILVVIPLFFIDSIIIAFALKLSFLNFAITFILPTLASVLVAIIGLIANLYLPKMDAINETQAVKQSLSVLVAVGAAFAFLGALVGGYFALQKVISFNLFALFAGIILSTAIVLLHRFLFTKGITLFNRLKA